MDLRALIHNQVVQVVFVLVLISSFVLTIVLMARYYRRQKRITQIYIDGLRDRLESERKEVREASLKSHEALEEVKRLILEDKGKGSDIQTTQATTSAEVQSSAFPWRIKPSILKNALTDVKYKSLDYENESAQFEGNKGEIYNTTLKGCDCLYFKRYRDSNEYACKHMIRLAIGLGIIDMSGKLIVKAKNSIAPLDKASKSVEYANKDRELPPPVQLPVAAIASNNGSIEKPNKPAPIAFVADYLANKGFKYVDMSNNGGGIYFFDEDMAEEIKQQGYNVKYAPHGTRKTNHRPAWYVTQ